MKCQLKNKKVTVVGLARSGMAAALLLCDLGADVYASDSGDSEELRKNAELLKGRGVKVQIGGHSRDFVEDRELIIISPGIPETSQAVIWAGEAGIPIISEIELGYLCCNAPIVAITGTNGKSTVTTLIGEILKIGGRDVVVCGNLGNPFCGESSKIKNDSIVVLEVSSFQLERIKEFKPHISVLLNISQNHFDRHPDLNSYKNAKAQIFRNQDDANWAVLNYDDQQVRQLSQTIRANVLYFSRTKKVNGAYLNGDYLMISFNGRELSLCEASELKIKGGHNVENVLAGLCVGSILGINPQRIANAVMDFRGLEHRFEYVTSIDSIDFINDSKSTTVLSTMRALEACDKPVILIAGGKDKGSDFRKARSTIAEKVKSMVLIGTSKDKIKEHLRGVVPITEADSMEEAVKIAYFNGGRGECVLLSPMCASFDMFRDFEDRGRVFKEAVFKIQNGYFQ